jgi:hypothetical protein
LVKGSARNADTPSIGESLYPGRYIYPIAIDSLFLLDHIPKLDSDPKFHPAVFRQVSVSGSELLLDLHGALDRVHHAGKLSQKVIPRRVHHPTPMLPDDA